MKFTDKIEAIENQFRDVIRGIADETGGIPTFEGQRGHIAELNAVADNLEHLRFAVAIEEGACEPDAVVDETIETNSGTLIEDNAPDPEWNDDPETPSVVKPRKTKRLRGRDT